MGAGIHITTAKRVARQADRRLQPVIKEEGEEVSGVGGACCRRVVAVEGCTAKGSTAEGSTAVAVMAIHITTIKVAARRITEEGSTGKGEG